MSKGITIRKQGAPQAGPAVQTVQTSNAHPGRVRPQVLHDDEWLREMEGVLYEQFIKPVRATVMQLRVASRKNGDFATIDLTNGFSRSLWLALFNTDSLQENTVEYEEFIEFLFKADEVALMRDVNSEGEEVILFSNTNEDWEDWDIMAEDYPDSFMEPKFCEEAALWWLTCELAKDPARLSEALDRLVRRT